MSTEIAVEQMSAAKKIALMERLWDDLSRRPEDLTSPEWQLQIVNCIQRNDQLTIESGIDPNNQIRGVTTGDRFDAQGKQRASCFVYLSSHVDMTPRWTADGWPTRNANGILFGWAVRAA